MYGAQTGNTIVTADRELAFTFIYGESFHHSQSCCGKFVLISYQGMAVHVTKPVSNSTRVKRSRNGNTYPDGFLFETELNGRLQEIETRILELAAKTFKTTAKSICLAMGEMSVTLANSFKVSPSLTVRKLPNSTVFYRQNFR